MIVSKVITRVVGDILIIMEIGMHEEVELRMMEGRMLLIVIIGALFVVKQIAIR